MDLCITLPQSTALQVDPPYRLLIPSKDYNKVRKYLIFYIMAMIILIFRNPSLSNAIISLVIIASFLPLIHDSYYLLELDNDGWKLQEYRSLYFHLKSLDIKLEDPKFIITIVSTERSGPAKIEIIDEQNSYKLKTRNEYAKELKDFVTSTNKNVTIKRRGHKKELSES